MGIESTCKQEADLRHHAVWRSFFVVLSRCRLNVWVCLKGSGADAWAFSFM